MNIFTKKPTTEANTATFGDPKIGAASYIATTINWIVIAFAIFIALSIAVFSVAYESYYGSKIMLSIGSGIVSMIGQLLILVGGFIAVISAAKTLDEGDKQEWKMAGIAGIIVVCGLAFSIVQDIPAQADKQLAASLKQAEVIDEMKAIVSSRSAWSFSGYFSGTEKAAATIATTNIDAVGQAHTVEKNETLSDIATCYGVTVAQIMQANENIIDASSIRAGQGIIIPD